MSSSVTMYAWSCHLCGTQGPTSETIATHMAGHVADLTAERDRARDAAVALEDENAALRRSLTSIRDLLRDPMDGSSSIDSFAAWRVAVAALWGTSNGGVIDGDTE